MLFMPLVTSLRSGHGALAHARHSRNVAPMFAARHCVAQHRG